MKKIVALKTQTSGPDKLLVMLPILLTLAGVLMVTNASVVQAQNLFGDKFFFAKQQTLWAAVGLIGFLVAARIPYMFWRRVATPLFWMIVFLLVVVLIPRVGTLALGARRWIEVSGFTFQPAELAKLSVVLYGAKLLGESQKILAFFFGFALVSLLVILEPDLGTTLIIAATSLTLLFISGVPLILFVALFPLGALVLFLVIATSSYRRERFLSFISGVTDPLQASYHVKQVIFAIASGGLFGVGLGQSRQKFLFLPEATTDSIFAVIAEEVGFAGSVVLILLFVVLVGRILLVARSVQEDFGKLVAAGIGAWIGIQVFINIAAMTATVPLTGVPLPFFSYGGSSLIVTLFALGIVVNISRIKSKLR